MQTTPADLNRRRRIGDAIDAIRLIDSREIALLDDNTLMALHVAIASKFAFAENEMRRRAWSRQAATGLTANADTAWPDAIEEIAA